MITRRKMFREGLVVRLNFLRKISEAMQSLADDLNKIDPNYDPCDAADGSGPYGMNLMALIEVVAEVKVCLADGTVDGDESACDLMLAEAPNAPQALEEIVHQFTEATI